jgi:hypothetical protein
MTSPAKPQVSDYGVHNAVIVTVRFTDGTFAQWHDSVGGLGASQTIEQFQLRGPLGSAHYVSPYQEPRNVPGDGFIEVTGFSLEQIVAYWQAAVDFVGADFRSSTRGTLPAEHRRRAWDILSNGLTDLSAIRRGKWPLPS